MATFVYILCGATSTGCAILTARSYWRSGSRMQLWTAIGFCGLALNNILLYLDLEVVTVNLSIVRTLPALVGMCFMTWGLIRDTVG